MQLNVLAEKSWTRLVVEIQVVNATIFRYWSFHLEDHKWLSSKTCQEISELKDPCHSCSWQLTYQSLQPADIEYSLFIQTRLEWTSGLNFQVFSIILLKEAC